MLPILLLAGAAVAGALGLVAISKPPENPEEERLKRLKEERLRRITNIPGGEYTVNAVKLVSANYQGKIKVTGKGVPVHACAESWEDCEFELKLAAAEAKCNIVINVRKDGNRTDGFSFQGTAYQKA